MDPGQLRTTFDEVADLYDLARPRYPAELFADLVRLAGVGPTSRILEIGPGTGQATLPLAERGCEIVAVELGAELAAVARRNLAAYPNAAIITSSFEDWPLPTEPFDLILSATAFHWIDPAVRLTKTARALRPGGALALISTHHVAGGTEQFFIEVQNCYERWDPSTPPGLRLPPASQVTVDTSEIEATGLFGPVVTRRYEVDIAYSTAEYLNLLRTYSGDRLLPPEARAALHDCIGKLIDSCYGGRIEKRYLFVLQVATRGAPAGKRPGTPPGGSTTP